MFDYDAYFNTPEKIAERKADMAAYYADREAKEQQIAIELKEWANTLNSATNELKAANELTTSKPE